MIQTKKKFFLSLLFVSLIFVAYSPRLAEAEEAATTPEGPTFYQIGEVYTPRLLPGSPWYFLKTIRDNLILMLTFDEAKKAALELTQANKRLLEVQRVCELGDCGSVNSWVDKYEVRMGKVAAALETLEGQGLDVAAFVEEAEDNLSRQQLVLERLYQLAPEAARGGLLQAKERVQSRFEVTARNMGGDVGVEQLKARIQNKVNQFNGKGNGNGKGVQGDNSELDFEVDAEEESCETCQR